MGVVIVFGMESIRAASLDLHEAIRRGTGDWHLLLASGKRLEARDADGNTPLHLAALRGNGACVDALLAKGVPADPVNEAGATPLLYGITDLEIVRSLLRAEANPNQLSKLGMTPLLAAVSRGRSYEIAKLLVDTGADVHVNREGPWDGGALFRAIQSGDPRTIDLMFEKGVGIEAYGKSYSPLHMASMMGDLATVQRLVEAGADLNYSDNGWGDAPGHALNWALWAEEHEVAAYLIDRGVDLNFAVSVGTETPPMVWAGFGQSGDSMISKKLLAAGLDINTENARGETVLSYALQSGEQTELVHFLRGAGARARTRSPTTKVIPANRVPTATDARTAMVRDGAQRAIDLMQLSSKRFLERRESCASCHHQFLPAMAYDMGRRRGLRVDPVLLGQQLAAHVKQMKANETSGNLEFAFGGFDGGKGFVALHALGYAADDTVWKSARFLRETQTFHGTWSSFGRAPMDEPCSIQQTAWAIGGLRRFPTVGDEPATTRALERAMEALRADTPSTVTQRNAQLLGLHWGGLSADALQPQFRELLGAQRADGGWGQLPTLPSDAWATGQTLYALNQAGAFSADEPAYRRGVDFLLQTQFEDGSWWVKTRAWPFQPHFDSGFPHGRDQWISIAGTAWATMALLATLPVEGLATDLPTGQELIALWEASRDKAIPTSTSVSKLRASSSIQFQEDILPLLERSCLKCHSGDRPKGGFRVTSRGQLLKGGQGGEPAVKPGDGRGSNLVRFALDQVEDLEMPPLDKRSTYPAMSAEEIEMFVRWIDEGAE